MSRNDQLSLAAEAIGYSIAVLGLTVLVMALAYWGLKTRRRRCRPAIRRTPVPELMSGSFLVEVEPAHEGTRWHWLLLDDAVLTQFRPYAAGCSYDREAACSDAKLAALRLIDWETFAGPVNYRFEEASR